MKTFLAIALALSLVCGVGLPAFAGTGESTQGQEQVHNVKTGGENAASGGMREYMDATAQEAAKGKSTGDQLTGVVAGSAIGVRKGIHRIGAGAIDLLTFWIPKKQPLITPEEPRLK